MGKAVMHMLAPRKIIADASGISEAPSVSKEVRSV
jgi:hypothetical protein